jgi:hypothetical protein
MWKGDGSAARGRSLKVVCITASNLCRINMPTAAGSGGISPVHGIMAEHVRESQDPGGPEDVRDQGAWVGKDAGVPDRYMRKMSESMAYITDGNGGSKARASVVGVADDYPPVSEVCSARGWAAPIAHVRYVGI